MDMGSGRMKMISWLDKEVSVQEVLRRAKQDSQMLKTLFGKKTRFET